MKTGFKTLLLLSIGASMLQFGCAHRNHSAGTSTVNANSATAANAKPAAPVVEKPAATAPANQPALTNMQDRVGYAIGITVGSNLKRVNFDVNLDDLMQGIKDVLGGHEPKMTEQQAREAIMAYEQKRQQELALKNQKEGEVFLAENKKKEGVKVQPLTLPDGTMAELQYKIVTEGTGEIPKSNDTVSVNYRGTFIQGTEFDSSAKHGGRPAKFVVNRVIRGWTEALQMMKVGSKWELFIPASLAYGERPSSTIPPGSTLIFEVELLDIEKPKSVSSDIVRVPSAEEMKAGAKVEVIKAEDAEKMATSQTNQATNQVTADKK